jgi:polyhydroxyalkanoate synthesis repressor PhaR
VLLIKRYPNRKLYDTEASCYVTLADIAELVRMGEEIRVLDHASGDDLTESTLAQVISLQARRRPSSLPLKALSKLIGASEGPVEDWLGELWTAVDELEQGGDLTSSGADRLRRLLDETQGAYLQPRILEQQLWRVLDHLSLPRRSDLQRLHSQLDYLYDRLDMLLAEPAEPD